MRTALGGPEGHHQLRSVSIAGVLQPRFRPAGHAAALVSTSPSTGVSSTRAAGGLPEPVTYAQTCRLVGSWCSSSPGSIPPTVLRAAHWPTLAGAALPCIQGGTARPGRPLRRGRFGGAGSGSPAHWLGPRPGRAWRRGAQPHAAGRLVFGQDSVVAATGYQGPALGPRPARGWAWSSCIRRRWRPRSGRLVGAPGPPTLDNGATVREWPGSTWVKAPGCYAFQVDGTDFSYRLVMLAPL